METQPASGVASHASLGTAQGLGEGQRPGRGPSGPFFVVAPDEHQASTYNPWELRFDKDYDDIYPATIIHPNGSLICSPVRSFLGVAARLVYEMRLATVGL